MAHRRTRTGKSSAQTSDRARSGRPDALAEASGPVPPDADAARAKAPSRTGRPSALIDTRVIYCGDCLDQLRRLPDQCVDRPYLWHRFPTGDSNSNRSYEVFGAGISEPRAQASGFPAHFEDRHASTAAYIDYMRPRCVELARLLKKTGSTRSTRRVGIAHLPGFLVPFDYTADALREIDAFFRKSGKSIVALTVREVLEEELARKLA